MYRPDEDIDTRIAGILAHTQIPVSDIEAELRRRKREYMERKKNPIPPDAKLAMHDILQTRISFLHEAASHCLQGTSEAPYVSDLARALWNLRNGGVYTYGKAAHCFACEILEVITELVESRVAWCLPPEMFDRVSEDADPWDVTKRSADFRFRMEWILKELPEGVTVP